MKEENENNVVSKENDVPLTPLDNFNKMAEINPLIIKLKEELDLDIEF